MNICDHAFDRDCPEPFCNHQQPHECNEECKDECKGRACMLKNSDLFIKSKCIPVPRTQFVCFQGIVEANFGQKFFSENKPDSKDQCKSNKGEVWYRIIGFADTVEAAQIICYGRSYT